MFLRLPDPGKVISTTHATAAGTEALRKMDSRHHPGKLRQHASLNGLHFPGSSLCTLILDTLRHFP